MIENYAILYLHFNLFSDIATKSHGRNTMLDDQIFSMLQGILRDTWGLTLQYFSGPDDEITRLDLGIRTHLQQGPDIYKKMQGVASLLEYGEVLTVHDPFGMDSVLLRISPTDPSFYVIGPFFPTLMEEGYLEKLGSQNGLMLSQMHYMETLFRQVPDNLSSSLVASIGVHLLREGCGCERPVLKYRDFSKEALDLNVPAEDINERAHDIAETYTHETALLDAIATGNEEKALAEGKYFLSTGIDRRLQDRIFSQRSLCYSVNTLCRKVSQTVGVHPLFCDEISKNFAKRLELCSSTHQINRILYEMYREYSRLCREYGTKNYSPATRKVLQYIQLNLSQDLSLKTVAQETNFSEGYISHSFKEEVGVSLNSYVTARRVDAACRMLARSDLSIREISSYVGIPDWNYFTKIFRKEMGCTPREYRKKLNE